MSIRFIGDIHGDWKRYVSLTRGAHASVQVGDLGVGFTGTSIDDVPLDWRVHRFIRGNHDNPYEIKKAKGFICDGFYDQKNKILYVGGAYSIDKTQRTMGVDWWEEEEMTYRDWDLLARRVEMASVQPDIVVSHDCPASIAQGVIRTTNYVTSLTGNGLQALFDIHKPSLWIFGHHHVRRTLISSGCEFVALGENDIFDLEGIDPVFPQAFPFANRRFQD